MALLLRVFAALVEELGLLETHQEAHNDYLSSSRAFDTLISPLWAPCMHEVYIHMYMQTSIQRHSSTRTKDNK